MDISQSQARRAGTKAGHGFGSTPKQADVFVKPTLESRESKEGFLGGLAGLSMVDMVELGANWGRGGHGAVTEP